MSITLDGSNLGTVGNINSATAQNSTSGTVIDFTGIPAGVKRVIVVLNGVSTNGASRVQIQIGAGSILTTGYNGSASYITTGVNTYNSSSGFQTDGFGSAGDTRYGNCILCLVGSNTWVFSSVVSSSVSTATGLGGGAVALSGALDRVRITTVNGTDTFDAGSINILYE